MEAKTNTISKCSLCGFCKANCPSFLTSLKEKYSPRGRAVLIKNERIDESFYSCSLCMACTAECPALVDLDLMKIRERLVENGIETEANKKMIENIRKHGNPFGKIEKGETPKKLYCC